MTDVKKLAELREPFPKEQIGKLPKGGIQLDFVGHGYLTARLLDVDPLWNWEPVALDPNGLPLLDEFGGLWIKLTVCNVTRLGYGDAGGRKGPDAIKVAIGDALRNAGMRFGLALDLWCKGDPDAAPPKPKLSPAVQNLVTTARRLNLNTKELGQRFHDDYGISIYDADSSAVEGFTKVITEEEEEKAQQAAIDQAAEESTKGNK